MKFLITGITGFAGPHLANLLHKEGHEVYGLIRRTNGMESDIRDVIPDEVYESITFFYADLCNYRSLRKVFEENEFDGVFHLAAQSHPPTSFIDPIGTMETNVIGSANLIQVIQDHQPDCKLMFCSTSEVYGNVGQDGRKIHWEDTIFPANPYGASKALPICTFRRECIMDSLKDSSLAPSLTLVPDEVEFSLSLQTPIKLLG